MGVRNVKKEQLSRLAAKSLDQQFVALVRDGLHCSPFEAAAVVQAVHEVYGPYLGAAPAQMMPGRISLVAAEADEPAGKPLSACVKQTVCLTVHRGVMDDEALHCGGPAVWRRSRIAALCQEALSQGALLTREDLAYRVFFVGTRTISRDLSFLRSEEPDTPVPLRSTVHDIGPVLTHRVEIVRLALDGLTTSEICVRMRHSPQAVSNYVSTFIRCAQLHGEGLHTGQIAFLLKRGRGLVQRYLDLVDEADGDPNRAYHLKQMLALGRQGEKKQRAWGGARHDA